MRGNTNAWSRRSIPKRPTSPPLRQEEIRSLHEKEKDLQQKIKGLEREIAAHKREIKYRDDTIGEKEKKIYELKKKNQEASSSNELEGEYVDPAFLPVGDVYMSANCCT